MLAFVVLSMLTASPAQAHSALLNMDPAPNTTHRSGAHSVKLRFSTPFISIEDVYQAEMEIRNPSGEVVDPSCSQADLNSLEGVYTYGDPGRYTMTWRAVSEDGHVLGSSYTFVVVDQDTASVSDNELCLAAGMKIGEFKEASHQEFAPPIRIDMPLLGITILVASLAVLALFRLKRHRTRNPGE